MADMITAPTLSGDKMAMLKRVRELAVARWGDAEADRGGWIFRAELGLNSATARKEFKSLLELGLLRVETSGSSIVTALTDSGRAVLAERDRAEVEARKPEVIERRIRESFLDRVQDTQDDYRRAAESFHVEVGRDATAGRSYFNAIGSEAGDLIRKEATAGVWEQARRFVKDGGSIWLGHAREAVQPAEGLGPRLRQLADLYRAELLDLATRRSWESGASDPFRRAAEQAQLAGKADGWKDVAMWAGLLADRLNDAAKPAD